MFTLAEYLHAIGQTKDIENLLSVFRKYSANLGMDQFAYLNFSIKEKSAPICRHTYSKSWIDRYFDKEYYEIDPVFTIGRTASLPFVWGQSNEYSKAQQELMSEGAEFGLGWGLTIPSRSAGFKTAYITLVNAESRKEFQSITKHRTNILHMMALHLDAKFVELYSPPTEVQDLTPRELECLKWAVYGKTNPEMAEILAISEKTIEAHFSNVFRKLSVFSRTQAVVKSLTLGLVHP